MSFKYDKWQMGGYALFVSDLVDDFLVKTIRSLESGPLPVYITNGEHAKWLIVLKGEALKRGLDWTKPSTRRVGLVCWICEAFGEMSAIYYGKAIKRMEDAGVVEPELEICNKTNKILREKWTTLPCNCS